VPAITDRTLQLWPGGAVTDDLSILTVQSPLLAFRGTGFVYDIDRVFVWIGTALDPKRFECALNAATNTTHIVCSGRGIVTGPNMTFTVSVLGVEVRGHDVVHFPQAAEISSLTGCPRTRGAGTADCPTRSPLSRLKPHTDLTVGT
jgi:hypothetical protein